MSTLNPTRKISRRHELREDTVITFYAHVLDFIENNRGIVIGSLVAIVLVVAAGMGYFFLQDSRNEEAMGRITQAVQKYEAGEYQAALDGDASFAGMIDVVNTYGGTVTGNLARFYAADALFRTGDYDRALGYFEDFDKDSNYLGASALAGEAAIYEIREDFSRAADLYMDAADIFPNKVTSPDYLLNAARSFERAGKKDRAKTAYEQLSEQYPDAQQAKDINFFIARLETSE